MVTKFCEQGQRTASTVLYKSALARRVVARCPSPYIVKHRMRHDFTGPELSPVIIPGPQGFIILL